MDDLPFRRLLGLLEEAGAAEQAEDLRGVLACAWTSSSEMAGELGRSVLRIQARLHPAPPPVRAALSSCLGEVRKVWPRFR